MYIYTCDIYIYTCDIYIYTCDIPFCIGCWKEMGGSITGGSIPIVGWFLRQNPTKMDDLGVPPFMDTPISRYCWLWMLHEYERWLCMYDIHILVMMNAWGWGWCPIYDSHRGFWASHLCSRWYPISPFYVGCWEEIVHLAPPVQTCWISWGFNLQEQWLHVITMVSYSVD